MIIILPRRWAVLLCCLPFFLVGAAGAIQRGSSHANAVLIDPGHGGIDGGCQDARGRLEKDLNLAVARRVETNLSRLKRKVLLTRTDDRELGRTYGQDLAYRLDTARRIGAAALVSIHANWYRDPAAAGAVLIIPPASPVSAGLADAMAHRLSKVCTVASKPVVMNHPLLAADSFPTVLVEMGFLSNPAEANKLWEPPYQEQIARAIAQGIDDFLGKR